jgi:tripartite-type tricarboxylate transporter receptor subunit TctC
LHFLGHSAVKTSRRRFLHLTSFAASAAYSRTALAVDEYPSRPIHLIVGFAPGGGADLIARLVGQQLSERLHQPVVIEDRAGASGNIATEMVIHAPPDGYTLLELTSVNSWNVALFKSLRFDVIREIIPVASIYRGVGVLVVNPAFPAKTLPDFIAYVRSNPGKLRMASGGVGTPQHLFGELFKQMTGVDMLHVPYRGGGPALIDLLGGHVDVMFDTLVTSITHIRAGELRALGVTSAERMNVLPNVPAIGEVVSGYEAVGWQGIGAPAGTPPQIVVKLNRMVNLALSDPQFLSRLTDLGGIPFASSPDEFRKFMVEFTDKWTKVIRTAGIEAS